MANQSVNAAVTAGLLKGSTSGVAGTEANGDCIRSKLLIVAWQVPPSVSAITTVAAHLAAALGPEEVVLAGQAPAGKAPGPNHPDGFQVVCLRRTWTGRGENILRQWSTPLLARRIRNIIREEHCTSVLGIFPDEAYLAAPGGRPSVAGVPSTLTCITRTLRTVPAGAGRSRVGSSRGSSRRHSMCS